MLRISFRTEPYWLDLPHGVRLQVRPPGTAVILAAGTDLAASAANGAAASSAADPATAPATGAATTPETGPDTVTLPHLPADGGRFAFTCAVARAAILDWEGVADAEGGPLPVSTAAIDALMTHWPVFAAFERLYLQPALLVVAEGNA